MSKLACGIRSMMAKNAFLRISRQAATSNGLIRQSIFTNARTVHQTANRDKTIVSPSSSNTTISPLTPQMSLKNTIQRGILLFKKIRNETLAIASESSETITTEQLKYMPINTSYRHRWVVWLLIGGNLVVFAMWAFALDQVEKNKDHTLIDLWKKTFTPRWNDLENKDWWKFVRSSFNYTTPGHCMIDSAMLYLFAPPVVAIMGPSAFIGLYLCSGALTSISCLLWQQYSPFDRQEIDLDNLGADGSNIAFMTLMLLLTRPHCLVICGVMPAIDTIRYFMDRKKEWRYTLQRHLGVLFGDANGRSPAFTFVGVALGALVWRYGLKRARYESFYFGPSQSFHCTPKRLNRAI